VVIELDEAADDPCPSRQLTGKPADALAAPSARAADRGRAWIVPHAPFGRAAKADARPRAVRHRHRYAPARAAPALVIAGRSETSVAGMAALTKLTEGPGLPVPGAGRFVRLPAGVDVAEFAARTRAATPAGTFTG